MGTPATAAAAGGTISLAGIAAISLTIIRAWIADTSADRAELRAAARAADADRTRYLAAEAALEAERNRIRTDLAEAHDALRQELDEEKARLQQEFEDRRAQVVANAFEYGVRYVRSGALDDPEPGGTVVRFPIPPQPADRATGRG